MIKKLFPFILILLCFNNGYSLNLVETNLKHIIGVQIFNFDKKYRYDLDQYFSSLKKAGINTVFVRVFQNNTDRIHFDAHSFCKSGVYYHTDVSCTVFDLLDYIIPYAKKYDIDVFAWMATRSLSFLKERYGFETEERDGNIQYGYGVNIFQSDVQKDLVDLFVDLSKYDIDGILIQDDFILRMGEGISELSKERYYVDYGKLPLKNDIDWYIWKMESLSSFLEKIKYEVKKVNPKIKIAVNIYYETPLFEESGLKWYAQSIDRYKKLDFPYFAVMAYHRQIMDELNINFMGVLTYINNMSISLHRKLESQNILMKIQIREFNKSRNKLDDTEVKSVCNLISNYGFGIIYVPFEELSDLKYQCF